MASYKLKYTLKRHKNVFTTVPRPTFPSDEIRELQTLHGKKLKTMIVVREGGDVDFHPHPDNKGQFYLHTIVK